MKVLSMKLSQFEMQKLKDMIKQSSIKRLSNFQKLNLSATKGQTLFVGDSMIDYLDINKFLPEIKALNRGIAGATTKLIKNYFDIIFDELDPKEIWISIGSNDLVLLESTPEMIVTSISELFSLIMQHFSKTKIYYLSTTPVIQEGHPLYKKIYIGCRTKEENIQINEGVKKLTTSSSIA